MFLYASLCVNKLASAVVLSKGNSVVLPFVSPPLNVLFSVVYVTLAGASYLSHAVAKRCNFAW